MLWVCVARLLDDAIEDLADASRVADLPDVLMCRASGAREVWRLQGFRGLKVT